MDAPIARDWFLRAVASVPMISRTSGTPSYPCELTRNDEAGDKD